MRASPATVIYVGAAALGLALAYLVFVKAKAAAGAVVEDVTGAVTHAAEAVNPVNPDNVFAKASNAVAQSVSGDASATLGTWLWTIMHSAQVAAENVAIGATPAPSSPPPSAPATPSNGSLIDGIPGIAAVNAAAPDLSLMSTFPASP